MKITVKNTSKYVAAWLGAGCLAVAFAVASPNDGDVMGHMPSFIAHTLARKPIALPEGLPSDRTLALITFQRGQKAQADSWIQGLNLNHDTSISWMRMPVVNDPGTTTGRNAAENRLLAHYPAANERARLVPVFTDRNDFVRTAGLSGVDQFSAVVLNRRGEVLARVEGEFDAVKAEVLRETLKQQDL